jgi:SET domain-containing protein
MNVRTALSDLVKLSPSNIEGVGLVAAQFIKKKTSIQRTHFFIQGTGWLNLMPNCQSNHSVKNENCEIVTHEETKYLVSLKDIQIGEEILVDYTKDGDLEQPQAGWEK